MPTKENSTGVDRISAAPGSEEYERQFQQQSSSAIQRYARMPLVRIVCGVLTLVYCCLVALGSVILVRSQIADGLHVGRIVDHIGTLVVMGWVISMQGRIALYGEFGIEFGLFAPRQSRA